MELVHAANLYIENSEPWTLAKDPAKAGELADGLPVEKGEALFPRLA